jgi:hypothetical protein
MWIKFVESLTRSVAEGLVTLAAQTGKKKVSELRGRKALEIAAATRVADEFVSALIKGAQGFACSCSTAHLAAQIREVSLARVLDGINLRSATCDWQEVDDSSESNAWGWWRLTFRGSVRGVRFDGQLESRPWSLDISLLKEEDTWKVDGFSLNPPSES